MIYFFLNGVYIVKKLIIASVSALLIVVSVFLLFRYNYIPHKKYDSADFSIEQYESSVDFDNDGVDDQTDILNCTIEYLDTNPKYKSKYYEKTGYPDDEYGVCTDVVAFALLGAGYDLMELVEKDISENPEDYEIEIPDKYIDFRRVENLKVYFDNNAVSLTTDTTEIEQWQGGDIVVFKRHLGIVSHHRNKDGIPFVFHSANPIQMSYEEDILQVWGEIVGHYRIS